jgi:hypothetical protein
VRAAALAVGGTVCFIMTGDTHRAATVTSHLLKDLADSALPPPAHSSAASSVFSDRVRTVPGAAAAGSSDDLGSAVVAGATGLSTPGRPRCCHARTASRAARMPLSALSRTKFLPASHVDPPSGARPPLTSASAVILVSLTARAWRQLARTFHELLESE